jgi:hypothetical protein
VKAPNHISQLARFVFAALAGSSTAATLIHGFFNGSGPELHGNRSGTGLSGKWASEAF